MQAYRRLASTATSSTSRSASHAHAHAPVTHASHTQGQSSRLSRSSSSIASVSSSSSIASATTLNNLTMTAPTDYAAYSYTTSRSPTSPTKGGISLGVPRSSMSGSTRAAASHFGQCGVAFLVFVLRADIFPLFSQTNLYVFTQIYSNYGSHYCAVLVTFVDIIIARHAGRSFSAPHDHGHPYEILRPPILRTCTYVPYDRL